MPLFRTQSAAEQTSLAPHDSKARLLSDHDSQGFMAKPCTPHPHCAARAVIQAANSQCAGSRGKAPRPFLLGGVRGDVLFPRKENIPPCRIPTRCGEPLAPLRCDNMNPPIHILKDIGLSVDLSYKLIENLDLLLSTSIFVFNCLVNCNFFHKSIE